MQLKSKEGDKSMSTIDKLIERFKAFPADFRFDELVRLLAYFGYEENNKGKTSGSRVAFMAKSYFCISHTESRTIP